MTLDADAAPVYVLIAPDGTATWGEDISTAYKELGPHGIGRAFLTDGSRLRIAMSDCALLLTEEYAPNPYAETALAHVAGMRGRESTVARGPVILFGWDPMNEWDSTRPFTDEEREAIVEGLAAAGCK